MKMLKCILILQKTESEIESMKLETEKIKAETKAIRLGGAPAVETQNSAVKSAMVVLKKDCAIKEANNGSGKTIQAVKKGVKVGVVNTTDKWVKVLKSQTTSEGFIPRSCF